MLELQLLCICAVITAVMLGLRLGYVVFKKHTLLLLLFGVSGIPDMLVTVEFAYLHPELEGNPLTKLFLGLPYMIVVGVFLWAFVWITAAELLERGGHGTLSQIVLLLLFIGHLWGFSTWMGRLSGTAAVIVLSLTISTLLLLYYIYRVTVVRDGRKKAEQQ
ncbi:MAG: hypothetical protein N3G76_01935 [Candidatus Micrarchaeota archaeon]|nr:hypothetical protein [Candidatus Micrarchaeota archaeon]